MEENIEEFIGYFQERLGEIADIKTGKYQHQYQKGLFLSVVDALARCVYPTQFNRKRFTGFIAAFSNWTDCQRVSLPHLARFLIRGTLRPL